MSLGKMQKKDPVALLAAMSAFYKLRTPCLFPIRNVMNVFFIEKAKKGMVQLFRSYACIYKLIYKLSL
jgi:hypothetical protein